MRVIRSAEQRRHAVVYGRRWRNFRERWLKAEDIPIGDPGEQVDLMIRRTYCAACEAGPLPQDAPVDHRKPHHGNPDLLWNFENLQRLCTRCHNRKTRMEQLKETL
jgi:5-methylcytosine-specific restriction endonuclease McrA